MLNLIYIHAKFQTQLKNVFEIWTSQKQETHPPVHLHHTQYFYVPDHFNISPAFVFTCQLATLLILAKKLVVRQIRTPVEIAD